MQQQTINRGLSEPCLWRHEAWVVGAKDMLKATPGVCAWGLVTGVAMTKAGLGLAVALAMSLTVFAASAQLAAMPLMLAGAPLWVVWVTAVCVNLRFVIFSTQMRRHMMALPMRWRLLAGYLTADMTFALMLKTYGDGPDASEHYVDPLAYFCGLSSVNWLTWNVASLLGVFLADAIPLNWGLELAGGLALLGLLATLANSMPKRLIAGLAGVVAVATRAWPYKLGIVAAVVVAVGAGLLWDALGKHRGTHE